MHSIKLPKNKEEKSNNYFIGEDDEKFHNVLSKNSECATSIAYKVFDTQNNRLMCKKIFKIAENKVVFKNYKKKNKLFIYIISF